MCNDYEQHVAWAEYCRKMASLALKIPPHQTEFDLPQADDVRLKDPVPIMRAAGDAIELASMTFGFPPAGPKRRTTSPSPQNIYSAASASCGLSAFWLSSRSSVGSAAPRFLGSRPKNRA